jgi:plastocyanin
VTSGDPGDPDGTFDEPLGAEGDTATVTFDEPGTFVYHCDLHRNMTGEVVVE